MLHVARLTTIHSKDWITKALSRLCISADWSLPLLFACNEVRLSCVVSIIISTRIILQQKQDMSHCLCILIQWILPTPLLTSPSAAGFFFFFFPFPRGLATSSDGDRASSSVSPSVFFFFFLPLRGEVTGVSGDKGLSSVTKKINVHIIVSQ